MQLHPLSHLPVAAPAASFTPMNNQPYNHHTITAPPRLRMEPPSASDGKVSQRGSSLTHPHPQNSRCTPRCPSVVLWTPFSGVEWRVFEPTIRVWRSGTTHELPANLGFESAEESLSILPDYQPTVRPPPKRC